jgi:recombination protein RecT
MSAQVLNNINRNTQQQQNGGNEAMSFPVMLQKFQGEIARALPKHINPDRMARIALTAFRQTPALAKCDPKSIFAAVIQSSQLGLEVGLMGEAHLVPFGGTCQLIPGYTGLMKLARQSGHVVDIYAHEVRINDTFRLTYGLERTLEHEPLKANGGFPASEDARGEVVGFYAVAVLKDGSRTFVAMSREEVEKIRDNSRGYQAAKKYKKESPWDTNFVPMGLKTVIRSLSKFLPKSPELAAAVALDNAAHNGKDQNLNLDDIIQGSFVIVDDEGGGADSDTPTGAAQQAEPADTGNKGASGEASGKQPAQGSNKAQGKAASPRGPAGTPIENACAELEKAGDIEALDEIYIRAEGVFEGADLEVLLRKYREVKAALAGGSGSLI